MSEMPLVDFLLGMNLRLWPSRDMMLAGNLEVVQRLWSATFHAWVKYKSAGILPVTNWTFFFTDRSGSIGNPYEALMLAISCNFWFCHVCSISVDQLVLDWMPWNTSCGMIAAAWRRTIWSFWGCVFRIWSRSGFLLAFVLLASRCLVLLVRGGLFAFAFPGGWVFWFGGLFLFCVCCGCVLT